MRLMEQDQKIGIEIELYGDRELAKEICKGHGLTVCGDASLGNDGVEIKFDQGVPIKDAMSRINMMNKIITDGTSLRTELVTPYDNSLLPSKIANKLNMLEADEHYCYGDVGERTGTTGLHVHFGIPSNYTFLDLIALAQYMDKNDEKVRKLAWRDSKVWAYKANKHLGNVSHGIQHTLECIEQGRGFASQFNSDSTDTNQLNRICLHHSKYTGMNIANVGAGLHTIEFRYADTALIADVSAFKKYLKFLTNAIQKHIVGRTEHSLKVDGVGKVKLSTVFKKPYEHNNQASYTFYDVTKANQKIARVYSLR